MTHRSRLFVLHFLGIMAFLSIPVFTSPDFGGELFQITGFRKNFFTYIMLAIFFYVNYYYFMPRLYFPKKYLWYICTIILCYAILMILPGSIFSTGVLTDGVPPPRIPGINPPNEHFGKPEGGSVFQFLFVLALSFAFKVNNQLSELSSEKLKAEVSYLKAQINPHFLFNTLNSLYALTIAKSDEAPDAVLKLSNMMRYVVTESSSEFVPLDKEVSYIKDYMELQRLRIAETPNLQYTIRGDSKGKSIAPLVLITFIENAFKYGVNAEEDWHISIALEILNDYLTLSVKNNKVRISMADDDATEQGIKNTLKRLAYIYPGKHEISFDDNDKFFHVHLKIDLI